MSKKHTIGHVNGKHRAAVDHALKHFQTFSSWKSVKSDARHVADLSDHRVFVENFGAKLTKT